MRSRSTCDWEAPDLPSRGFSVSISDEKPLHMRHRHSGSCGATCGLFQSQMRSRSTCDAMTQQDWVSDLWVSISDEKPLHMRHEHLTPLLLASLRFNLR